LFFSEVIRLVDHVVAVVVLMASFFLLCRVGGVHYCRFFWLADFVDPLADFSLSIGAESLISLLDYLGSFNSTT